MTIKEITDRTVYEMKELVPPPPSDGRTWYLCSWIRKTDNQECWAWFEENELELVTH